MLGEKEDDPARSLQLGHVGVEIDPVQALEIEAHVFFEKLVQAAEHVHRPLPAVVDLPMLNRGETG